MAHVYFISDYAWVGILNLVWVDIVVCGSLSGVLSTIVESSNIGVVGWVGPGVVVGAFEVVSEFIGLVWVVVALGPTVVYMFGWSVCCAGFKVMFMGWVCRMGLVIRVIGQIISGFVVGTSRHGGAVHSCVVPAAMWGAGQGVLVFSGLFCGFYMWIVVF